MSYHHVDGRRIKLKLFKVFLKKNKIFDHEISCGQKRNANFKRKVHNDNYNKIKQDVFCADECTKF